MNYSSVSHVLRTLTFISRYQRYKTVGYFSKNCNVLLNSQMATLKRCLCNAAKKESPKDSTTNLNADTDPSEMVSFFVRDTKTGLTHAVKGKIGQSVMECSSDCDVNVAGACGGKLSCTTCMMYLDDELFAFYEAPTATEEDLLDKASFLRPTSRLTCQLQVCKEIEGLTFTLPIGTVNLAVDGHQFAKH